MSAGAAANNMTFSSASRSFNNLGNATSEPKTNGINGLGTTFGNGNASQAWGSDKIWSNGGSLSNSRYTSRDATRENSRSRDGVQQAGRKTGSGSLVDSSVSEEWLYRTRASKMSVPNVHTSVLPPAQQQQRSSSNANLPALGGTAQSAAPFATRPPTINLNSSTIPQPRQAFPDSVETFEKAPTVYTKMDRSRQDRATHPDSAKGSYTSNITPIATPTDEQSGGIFGYNSRPTSSHDGSRDPPRHHSNQPSIGRSIPGSTPAGSRAPSFSLRGGSFAGANDLPYNLQQLSLGNGGSNGLFKPSSQQSPFGAQASSNGTSHHTRSATNGYVAVDDVDEEVDRPGPSYMGFDGYSSPTAANAFPMPGMLFNDRFAQTPFPTEFRPGSGYATGNLSPRTFHPSVGQRQATDWQDFGVGSFPIEKRSPGVSNPQFWLDPRLQQMMAAQQRSAYAAVSSPYALQNPLSMGNILPYMQIPPPFIPSPSPGFDPSAGPHDAPPTDNVQSALMYEFKSNNNKTSKRYELKDIYDHIAEFSGDQHGSRFIQQKLEVANSDEKEHVFREIQPNAIPLMTDVFGNYVIQKFFEHGDQNQKKVLANKMRGQILNLSLQMYGCRVVQKALEHILVDQQALLIHEIENHVLRCVKDQNGNHVVQKAIERCPSSTVQFIIDAFRGQVHSLSVHSYGCRVIQRCLEHCDPQSKAMVMSELHEGMSGLITDQYGNYVVQHVVEHGGEQDRLSVLQLVGRGLETYSRHKFASNVVEKCVTCAGDRWRRDVIYALSGNQQRRSEEGSPLVSLIRDSYGNYVIQKLLDTLIPHDYATFIEMLHPAVAVAKRAGCGKQVLSIEKKMHRFAGYQPHHGPGPSSSSFQQMPIPSPLGSHYNSGAPTPPLQPPSMGNVNLATDGRSGRMLSVTSDAVEGAMSMSRKGSEAVSSEGGILM